MIYEKVISVSYFRGDELRANEAHLITKVTGKLRCCCIRMAQSIILIISKLFVSFICLFLFSIRRSVIRELTNQHGSCLRINH